MLMIVPARQNDRLAAHPSIELEEGDDRAGEGQSADGGAERHLDAALSMDLAIGGDAEGFWRIIGSGGHEHGGKADERMEGGDELRHRRHGDAPGGDGADGAADRDAADDEKPGEAARRAPRGSNVVTIASAMPTMPKRLPCREDSGLDKPRSAWMNRAPETR